jgi:hypothetical protein
MRSGELDLHPSLWHVTFDQWSSAWKEYKAKQQESSPALPEASLCETKKPVPPPTKLSEIDLEKIRKKYGAANPYAWPTFPVETVPSMECSESTGVLVGAPSSYLEPSLDPHSETMSALCGADTASSFREKPGASPAPDFEHSNVPVDQNHEQTWKQLGDSSSMSLLIQAGHAAQRTRGKGPFRVPEYSRHAEEPDHATVGVSEVHAPNPTDAFVVKNVRRFSVSDHEEFAAQSSLPKGGRGSAWKTATRIFRQMRR